MLRRLSLLALILLALLLPFELETPWLAVGPVVLTNVELVLWPALALAFLAWWREGRRPLPVPRLWMWLGLTFGAALILSSLFAPDHTLNALKAGARTLSGIGLALAAAVAVRGTREVRWLAAALLTGGVAAAASGLLEVSAGSAFAWLRPFREAPTLAGPFLRLTGSFDYANQAAMYFEATLPLLLALLWEAWREGRRWLSAGLLALFLLLAQAMILTFSRASYASFVLTGLFIAAVLLWPRRGLRGNRLGLLYGGSAVLLVALLAGYLVASPAFRLRLQSEGDSVWYLATITAPPTFALEAGEAETFPVTVRNEGAFIWQSDTAPAVLLAARWVLPEEEQELAMPLRWPLPRAVAPGESETVSVRVKAPEAPGDYELVWDLIQEDVVWFGAKTGRETRSSVQVSGAGADESAGPTAGDEARVPEREQEAPIPGRLALWSGALELWQAHPLLGIGLDNYRLLYGPVLGLENANPTIHTNNWYVETVVSLGLLGALPFLLWLLLLFVDMMRRLLRPRVTVWQVALAAGLLAFLIHGLVDYFLLFTATSLLFWLLVGLWIVVRAQAQETAEQAGLAEASEDTA